MISIIISSYKENLFEAIVQNIEESIGDTTFEIVKVPNPGLMSIGNAYNKGAAIAKFEKLLFIHEDICFLSEEWGLELEGILEDKNTGIVGVAGGVKKFKLPTGHDQGIEKYRQVYVNHSPDEKFTKSGIEKFYRVKTLDGVFLAMKKNIWKEFKFDEELKDYHFYDLDISLRVSNKFTNYVASNIPILHYSKGHFDNKWIRANLEFHRKPYVFDLATVGEQRSVRRFWYIRLKEENINLKNRLYYISRMGIDKGSIVPAINFLFYRNIFQLKEAILYKFFSGILKV